MHLVRQCMIIFGCLAIGELLALIDGFALPSSITGLLILTILLMLGWVKTKWMKEIADFFAATLPFYFIPAGVAVMRYFDIILPEITAIIIASLGSTAITLIAAGWVHQYLRNNNKKVVSKKNPE